MWSSVEFADDEASIVLLQLPSPSELSKNGKAEDWFCMKLLQEV